MDTDTDSEITFDSNGYCCYCREYAEKTSPFIYKGESSEKKLNALVETIKKNGKGKKYDCLLGVSGGIDSCYTAFLLKKLGLRTLIVHMDNGWNSETSVRNIEQLINKLGFDYESYVLDWEEFRDLQISFLKASVPEIETPTDHAILGAVHRIAVKHNINYIVSAGNYASEGILPKKWHYDAKDLKYITSIHKKFGKNKLRSFPTFSYWEEFYYKFIKKIKIIYILNYFPYNPKSAREFLEKEIGFRYYGEKHHESVYTRFVQSYLLPVKFNIDYRKATLSSLICSGNITRDEAIRELSKPPYNTNTIEEDKQYIAKKLGLSLQELEKILRLPPKSFKDYPNDKWKLELIYKTYKILRKVLNQYI